MISGFAAMLSTENPEKQKQFLLRRLIRLLPLYWGLTLATFAVGQFYPALIGYTPTAEQLIKSMLFIPFQRATAKAGTALRPIVGLGHTLQMEMLFYLLFWLSMRVSRKYRGLIAAGACAAVALTGAVFPTKQPVIHFFTANPYVWTSFIVGLAVYGAFRILRDRAPKVGSGRLPAFAAVFASLGLAVPVFLTETSVWYDIFMFAAVFTAGLVWAGCGFRSPAPLVKLGNVSYSYYLLHYYTVVFAARQLNITYFSFVNVLLAVLVSAATWGISWVSWKLIEQRLTLFLQARLLDRRSGTAAETKR